MKRKNVTLSLPLPLIEFIVAKAQAEDVSISHVGRKMLESEMKRDIKRKKGDQPE